MRLGPRIDVHPMDAGKIGQHGTQAIEYLRWAVSDAQHGYIEDADGWLRMVEREIAEARKVIGIWDPGARS